MNINNCLAKLSGDPSKTVDGRFDFLAQSLFSDNFSRRFHVRTNWR